MDLGRKPETSPSATSSPASPAGAESKIEYPQFDMRDKVADEFGKTYDCDVGDELTATVKLRVSGSRKDNYGSSKTFEVLSIDNVVEEAGNPDEAEETAEEKPAPDDEEKVLGYKRVSKVSPPDTSAADLVE